MQLSEKLETFSDYFIKALEKNESHSSSIAEGIDSERLAYLNA